MRLLLPLFSAMLLLGGCKKNTPAHPASAALQRSINGSSPRPWNFSGGDQLAFTQSNDYTTGIPRSRWTLNLHSAGLAVTITFPAPDTSRKLPCAKVLSFGFHESQSAPDSFQLSVNDAGVRYDGPDSSYVVLTFMLFDKLATGGFAASLYGRTGFYCINQATFTNIPITFAQ